MKISATYGYPCYLRFTRLNGILKCRIKYINYSILVCHLVYCLDSNKMKRFSTASNYQRVKHLHEYAGCTGFNPLVFI